jgi:hypothetical protein
MVSPEFRGCGVIKRSETVNGALHVLVGQTGTVQAHHLCEGASVKGTASVQDMDNF